MYYVWTLFADCNKVLLVYGLTNLAKMEDESMDKMDPYQRGASDISEFYKANHYIFKQYHFPGTYS